jgi:hypothetical protein
MSSTMLMHFHFSILCDRLLQFTRLRHMPRIMMLLLLPMVEFQTLDILWRLWIV